MVKNYNFGLIIFLLLLGINANSQNAYNFFDDFESYAVGSYLAKSSSTWTTWSGSEGGSEDVKITDKLAKSGVKSIYMASTAAGGGPTDLVFPMPQLYDKGKVIYESNFYVEAGKGGYFNFQGGSKIGQLWTIDIYFVDNGNLFVTQNNNSVLSVSSTYPKATWFNFKVTCDLTINNWVVELNGTALGTFSTVINKISSLDFYPVNGSSVGGNGISGFYMDDFKIDYEPFVPLQKDGALLKIQALSLGLTGDEGNISAELINVGLDTIKSFEASYFYGGTTSKQTYSNLKIATLNKYSFKFDKTFNLAAGENDLKVEISNINGSEDNNTANNSKSISTLAVTPAPNKMYVGEELTGTWCGWCPRGAVALDYMKSRYPDHFIGIAIHGGDPMENKEYKDGIEADLTAISGDAPGYPSLASMRNAEFDPSAVESPFLLRIQEAAMADLKTGIKFDEATRELKASVSVNYFEDNSNNYNVALIMVEDSVKGTTSGYNQTNYYSSQSQNIPLVGAGHDWQAEPSTVPASRMVYNDVARVCISGYKGVSLGNSHFKSNKEVKQFTYTIPAEYKTKNIHFVAMLLNENGSINNASIFSFNEALANGYVSTVEMTAISNFNVYPNPVRNLINIDFNITEKDYKYTIINSKGQNVSSLKELNSNTVDVSDLNSGIYFIQVYSENNLVANSKFVIEK